MWREASSEIYINSGTGDIDIHPGWPGPATGDYRPPAGSPCVDAGSPAGADCGTDLAGNPRRLDGLLSGMERGDMGAYEFGHERLDAAYSTATSTVTSP